MAILASNNLWAASLLAPPILFFLLGLIATAIRSDLRIPKTFGRVMSLYLLFSIGFKGGNMLSQSGLTREGILAMAAAGVLSAVTPLWLFPILRKKLGIATAAGVGAAYGSVSAVTFIAATTMLMQRQVDFGGHMVAAMVIMEFPALVVGVMLARWLDPTLGKPKPSHSPKHPAPASQPKHLGLSSALRESLTNGSVVLLVGSLLIGALTTQSGRDVTAPLWDKLFYGILCFYLLDLGLLAGRGMINVIRGGPLVILTALLFPPINAAVGLGISLLFGLSKGDTFLMMVMAGSASYIAAPAALRMALPQAKAGIYVPMALTLTFPFNILLGLPLYWMVVEAIMG